MVVIDSTSQNRGRFVVSLEITLGPEDEYYNEPVTVHVQSKALPQYSVACRDAVRKGLAELEEHSRHAFPDYSFFKLKALERNVDNIYVMPAMVSTFYSVPLVSYLFFKFVIL